MPATRTAEPVTQITFPNTASKQNTVVQIQGTANDLPTPVAGVNPAGMQRVWLNIVEVTTNRYWDGAAWTEYRSPAHQPAAAPAQAATPVQAAAPVVYAPPVLNLYDAHVDPAQVLSPEQLEQFKHNTLTSFPTSPFARARFTLVRPGATAMVKVVVWPPRTQNPSDSA